MQVIAADLSERDAPARLCREIADRGLTVDVLVNNAGYGVPGAFTASEWARHEALLQVMVVAPAELTRRLLPGMVDRGYGRIINVASLAALVPAPAGHTLYAACKALVVKFSESLSNEVARSGVRVTALCPGFTRSEFHDVTGTRATVARLPRWLWMDAAAVARQGFEASMAGIPAASLAASTARLRGLYAVSLAPSFSRWAAGRRGDTARRRAHARQIHRFHQTTAPFLGETCH